MWLFLSYVSRYSVDVWTGVNTCGDLLASLPRIGLVVTPHRLEWLVRVSLGVASAEHSKEEEDGPGRKSIG